MKQKNSSVYKMFWFLFLVAFVEGGAVMAVELIGAKMIAPFYGNSLYVWSAVLALTLGGLATGYFAGGQLSEKYPGERTLFNILIVAALFVGLMPFIATGIMSATLGLGLKTGIVVSCLVFLFPPLALFGMVSPVIIRLISTYENAVGKAAGTVFGISTVGGVLFTFVLGFYMIPYLGLKASSYIIASLLAVFPVVYFIRGKKIPQLIALFFCLLMIIGSYKKIASGNEKKNSSYIRINYRSDGLLGQLMVADDLKAKTRSLFINNISQSFMSIASGKSKWTYIPRLAAYSSIKPAGSKVLLAGLGAGLLVKELNDLQFDVEVVELDTRMQEVAAGYFGLYPDTKITVDDFRHFIKTCRNKYDIIIADISFGENQPSYIYTLESFSEIKKLLNDDGYFFIHFPDILNSTEGNAAVSIGRTLQEAGFTTRLINTAPKSDRPSELLFFSTHQPVASFNFERQPEYTKKLNFPSGEKMFLDIEFSEGVILTDDKPMMEFLHEKTALTARMEGIEIITKTLIREGFTVF